MAESGAAPRGHLLRLLGAGFGVAVGVGQMIGAGILRSPGIIAASVPSTAMILTLWLLGALHAALGANVMAELGTAIPKAGGPYVFAHRAYGDTGGLIVGWTVWASRVVGLAATSVAFGEFLPLVWPRASGHAAGVAVGAQLLLYGANVLGLREGRAMQETTSLLKVLLLLAFALSAALLFPGQGSTAPSLQAGTAFGFAALIGSYQLIRGAYTGWDASVYFAEENVAPARSIPRALFLGVTLAASIYLITNATLLYALGVHGVAASPLPYTLVLYRIAGGWAAQLFAIGAMITVISSTNANVMIAPRVLLALSRDRLLPQALQSVNKGGSPHFAFLLTAIVSIVLASSGGFRLIFGMIAILTSLVGLLTTVAFFVLRVREPALERPFRAWFYPWFPAFLLAVDATLLVLFALTDTTGTAFAALLCLLCVPVGLAMRRWRARA